MKPIPLEDEIPIRDPEDETVWKIIKRVALLRNSRVVIPPEYDEVNRGIGINLYVFG